MQIQRIIGWMSTVALIAAAPQAGAVDLRFIGDLNLKAGLQFKDTTVGGLSGIVCDPYSGRLLALSDDRSRLNPARFYEFTLGIGEQGLLTLIPNGVTFLRTRTGAFFPSMSIDPEGLARLGNRLFFSSEGDVEASPRVAPAIFEIDSSGKTVAELPVPFKFIPESSGAQTQGVRNNAAFESLTTSNGALYTATEQALLQDGPEPSFENGTTIRILELSNLASGGPIRHREFAYEVDAAEKKSEGEYYAHQGVSEMLAIGEGRFLAMERSGVIRDRKWITRVKIYEFTLEGATNVASLASLRGASYVPVRKRLVLDLDDILPKLDRNFRSLDNLEAMCLGPSITAETPSLILISDDNFNGESQRTQVLAFELSK